MKARPSHLSKIYLRAMKAKARGKVYIRSLGRGKRPSSPVISRSCHPFPRGSQNSSCHSHSFNRASILRGQEENSVRLVPKQTQSIKTLMPHSYIYARQQLGPSRFDIKEGAAAVWRVHSAALD